MKEVSLMLFFLLCIRIVVITDNSLEKAMVQLIPCKHYTFVSRSGFGDKVADTEKRYVIDASCFFLVSWHRCLQLKFKTSLKCCRNSSLTSEYIIGLAALFASNRIVHMLYTTQIYFTWLKSTKTETIRKA